LPLQIAGSLKAPPKVFRLPFAGKGSLKAKNGFI
jgi:hypothetical protein